MHNNIVHLLKTCSLKMYPAYKPRVLHAPFELSFFFCIESRLQRLRSLARVILVGY